MANFFGIPDEVILDKNKVKVLNGIAGSAKSSNIDKILTDYGIEYGRYTSTNKLKRDAENRYGGHNDTIAGGLFKTVDGSFFSEEREVVWDTVVIDEILQTDSRVLRWIENHRGTVNIIVCTDTHQMLAPEYGEKFLKKFLEFCENPWVVMVNLEKTYRARTEETEKYYHKCYDAVDKGHYLYRRDKENFKIIPFAAMPYNHEDIYICHTNACENYLFEMYDIQNDYEAPLIPKGMIARKYPKNPKKYPILSQENAKGRQVGYWQPEDIGTPTRYQGSEVRSGQKCYYLVESFSKVEPREWYTVVSRMWDIRDLIIVICEVPKPVELKEFNGKPIKKTKTAILKDDIELEDGRKLSEIVNSSTEKTVSIPWQDMRRIVENIENTDDIHYSEDRVYFGGKKVMIEGGEIKAKKQAITMSSLLSKESDFDFKNMGLFMQKFESVQRKYYGQVIIDHIRQVSLRMDEPGRDKRSFQYGLDIKASYPTILKYEKLPKGGLFYPAPEEYSGGMVNSGKVDWYIGDVDGINGPFICTGEFAEIFVSDGWKTFRYIGTSESRIGSRMGDTLYDMSFRSIESNEKRKAIHYGLMDRQWLESIERDKYGVPGAYTINERNNHQLLMVAIRSIQATVILKIKNIIYGTYFKKYGNINCDCIYFDYDGDIQELGDKIKAELPNYDFRIFKNSDEDKKANVLYQTYPDLMSEKDLKRKRDRERIAEKRARARE